MAVTIITVGKKHESWVADGIQRYEKRLRKPFDVEWVLLPHSSLEGDKARQEESERILSRLKPTDFVVLLDESGEMVSSAVISERFEQLFSKNAPLTIVIGGAYGVDASVHERAHWVWSLSTLVFPHQLVRLILIEQLYRAQQIANGGKYHHD